MKDFAKSIRVCNGSVSSGSFTEIASGTALSNEVYEELKKNRFDKKKTVEFLSTKYKRIPDSKQYFEDVVEKVMKSYSNRTVNDTPAEYAKRPPKIVGGNSLPEELEKDVHKKDKEKVEDIEELKKTVNREVYVNQSEKTKAVLYDDGTIMLWDKNGNNYKTIKTSSLEDARKKLNSDFVKVGNSASDDKFAYVMREFEEGKLKTPDGKVVTDPAQAKAIAYSESKKTENGLARARNAMACNKKVKNSAVREYKHSDGRIAQIDFNEDGSDADMSIYEGSKEIEQKNFSTIRDAEQYVTSHGFRRI